MYRPNQAHLQNQLFSDLDNLTEKSQLRLEESWAGVFYRECFCRLDETIFAVLYTDSASRPNIPINVQVGLETMKAGFGWSDQQMHDAFLFNVQVRYALGYRNLGEGDFDLRTVYNFRRRLSQHMNETGENLIERAFEQITDEQMAAFELKTGSLRMDSTQIASNIQQSSRLQLLVELLQRTYRMLKAVDQTAYAEVFAPYLKGTSGQYVYHLKGQDTKPHLQRIGELIDQLLTELASSYGQHETYQMLERVFAEQFNLKEQLPQAKTDQDDDAGPPNIPNRSNDRPSNSDQPSLGAPKSTSPTQSEHGQVQSDPLNRVQVKPGKQISPDSLRSPDDPEASYRKKGHQAYEGYVTNVTETCDPDNPLQLIIKVQTEPNLTEDSSLLLAALPNLIARTDLDTLYNDAGFCSPEVDKQLRLARIKQVPSALRGRAPDPDRTHLSDFYFHFDDQGQLIEMTCPHQQTVSVEVDPSSGRYIARLLDNPCPQCRFHNLDGPHNKPKLTLRFSQAQLDTALRRQHCIAYRQSKPRLRAAVEATVGALKRPFDSDQTPVRGKFRVHQMMIGSAAMVNIRRIERYLLAKRKKWQQAVGFSSSEKAEYDISRPTVSFLSSLWTRCQHWFGFDRYSPVVSVFGF